MKIYVSGINHLLFGLVVYQIICEHTAILLYITYIIWKMLTNGISIVFKHACKTSCNKDCTRNVPEVQKWCHFYAL